MLIYNILATLPLLTNAMSLCWPGRSWSTRLRQRLRRGVWRELSRTKATARQALTERLSRVSHRGNNKVHPNLWGMQERIVNQAFANGFDQPLRVSLFDRPWTLQFDMNIVESVMHP